MPSKTGILKAVGNRSWKQFGESSANGKIKTISGCIVRELFSLSYQGSDKNNPAKFQFRMAT